MRYGIPRLRRSHLARPRLTDKLHASIGNGLTVLQAPGGYGKSSLAAEFVRDLDYAERWLTLDSGARAPEVLAERLVAALHGSAAWPPASADGIESLYAYAGTALRAFDEASEQPLLLVIDNAHEVNGSPTAIALLEWLLQSMPASAELLLITREPLPVGELDRLIAVGDATVLGPADLQFSPEETACIVAERRGLDARAVQAATGGWPVAVRGIGAGTVSVEGAAQNVAGGAWDRYLAAEVWAAVPGELQRPLMLSAVPAMAEEELVAPLMSPAEWQSLNGWLDRLEFFVEPTEGGGRRLNQVVHRYLRDRFRAEDPSGYEAAAQRCVRRLIDTQRSNDAVQLACSLDVRSVLATALRELSPAMLQRGSYALLEQAFSALGDGAETDAALRAFHARVRAHTGSPGDALCEAEAVLAEPGAGIDAQHHARLAKGRALRLLGRMDEVVSALETPLDDMPADRMSQAELAWHRAHAVLAVESDLAHAHALLLSSLVAAREAQSPMLELLCRSAIGQVLVMKGDGPAGVRELARAAQGWRRLQGSAHLPWVLNNLGMAHLMVGEVESAVSALEEARDEAQIARNRRAEAFATASLGDAYLAGGDAGRAKTAYEQALAYCAAEPLDETLALLATAGLAGALLELGDTARADFLVREAVGAARELSAPFEIAACLLQQAAVSSACELHSDAVTQAREAVERFAGLGADSALRTARYRLALIHFRDGNREAAELELSLLNESITAPWMVRGLASLIREHPLFAQWAVGRKVLGPVLRQALYEVAVSPEPAFGGTTGDDTPRISARSLGVLRVMMNGADVPDEAWESMRARELFYLFLSRRDGIRKEEAFEFLYPDMPASRCNSQFHSNLYRVRKALYRESIVKRDGAYMLNPGGNFDWDVDTYRDALETALRLPAGSAERATALEKALQIYRGPFAEAFYSEWAAALRNRLARSHGEALSLVAGHYAASGRYEAAAECMERLLADSPFNDDAAYRVALYRARSGATAAALAFLDTYRRDMAQEYGDEPSPRLAELRHEIASGHAV